MREGGRADTGCLLGFEGEGRKRGDPGGSFREEGGCLQSDTEGCRNTDCSVTVRTLVR